MQKLLAAVEAKQAQAVIVAKLDRLTRGVKDLGELLERFEKRGVALSLGGIGAGHGIGGRSAGDHDHDRGKSVGAGSDRRADARRMEHKRRNGQRVGNISYGYRLSPTGMIEPDPSEQNVVTTIHELRGRCRTLREIAAELNCRGYRTRRDRTGGTSTSSGLQGPSRKLRCASTRVSHMSKLDCFRVADLQS